jgi:hypothetical protein
LTGPQSSSGSGGCPTPRSWRSRSSLSARCSPRGTLGTSPSRRMGRASIPCRPS